MSQDKKLDDLPKSLNIEKTQKQVDDSNTLHEQLKKIKEESTQSGEEHKDIDNPIYDYCS
jgi:hypothetical protein